MNKYQVIWLLIRLVGVYFAYLTLLAVFGLLGSMPALFTLPKIDATSPKNANVSTISQNPPIRVQPISPGINSNTPDGTENGGKIDEGITDKFKGENVKTFVWFLILTAIYGAAAWYLLKDGRILYGILNREEPHGLIKEKEAEVTQLNLSDKQN
ncbi:MAG TPA: hypothetical protein VGC97_03180 [Pyrinomonadaceae bacterium]|jgi:hypothetical protein